MKNRSGENCFNAVLLFALTVTLVVSPVFGWGGPHLTITRAAIATLPEWQKPLLGAEWQRLGDAYCVIPDTVYADKKTRLSL